MTLDELVALLRELYREQDKYFRERFARSLPLCEGLFDRWERARELGFGEESSIYPSALVYGDVRVGAHTWIGPYTLLDGSGGALSIGSWCSVSTGVHIYTHDTVRYALSSGKVPKREAHVSIGDNVFIGAQSVITAGVRIGSRCLIAANSLVIRDVPEGSIVGGTPAKLIGHVEGHGEDVKVLYADGPQEDGI